LRHRATVFDFFGKPSESVVAALFASAADADASAREISESSYGFADSLWTQTDIERSGALSPSSRGEAINARPIAAPLLEPPSFGEATC
jgi:hypothetical protein